MSIEITQFNHGNLMNKYKHFLNDGLYWHQILVQNVEDLDRDAVLRTIMKSCKPAHFIPIQYTSSNNTATFLVKNCGPALQKLCSQNLIVINPYNHNKPFKISIKLCYANSNDLKINIHLNLTSVLNKRFSQETSILNLEHFAKDKELEQYCALSQSKLFFYVLNLVKNVPFKTLKLSNNDIDSLCSMKVLENDKDITLDLRNNCIKEVSELDHFQHLNVTDLWLDGNPVCNNYSVIDYSKSIKEHVKKLEKLDGINVDVKPFPPFRRNFLCDLTGYDLVDQFLEHYFTLYDAHNRSILGEMYHRNALFSVTSMYIPLQTTSSTAQLIPYNRNARNLKQISDFSKNAENLFIGPNSILSALNAFPITEHDPYSFTTDLIMYSEKAATIVVNGVFRECSESLLESDRLLEFTRTFVLLAGENGEYSIVNEMLNVTNATTGQALRAFKLTKVLRPQLIDLPCAQNDKELQDMAEAFKAITGLKTDWARSCLTESDGDLKKALILFMELFKKDRIPKTAFLK